MVDHTYVNGKCTSCGKQEHGSAVETGDQMNPWAWMSLLGLSVVVGFVTFKGKYKLKD